MRNPPNENLLTHWLKTAEPNAKLLRSWGLSGGISSRMTAFEIEYPNGDTKKMILRQPSDWTLENVTNAVSNEFKLLRLLSESGIKSQQAYHIDQTGEFLNRPSLVVEFIEGNPNLNPNNLSDYLKQFAANLAAIHGINSTKADLSFLPTYPGRFVEDLTKNLSHLDSTFQTSRIQKAVLTNWPIPQKNEPVLLHGDFWPGNTLWKDGQFIATIDWEEAKYGDPLLDLAISRLDLSWTFGMNAVTEFTNHYLEQNPIDISQLPYWDLSISMRPVTNLPAWASSYAPLGREDITENSMIKTHQVFIEQAFSKLGNS